jgi:hypothetical protein
VRKDQNKWTMALVSTLSPPEAGINIRILSLNDDNCNLALDRLPSTQTEADHVEQVLTSELNTLSLEDIDKVLFDIHGIAQVSDEDPENVDDLILDLVQEIGKIKKKTAFIEANYINPNYVTSKEFRLRFLRCERFDPPKAAKKLVKHFESKRMIFSGGDILGREITLADLSEDDLDVLRLGFMQYLPTRDSAGRVVFVCSSPQMRYKSFDNLIRGMWYLHSTIIQEEENQKKGIVAVMYAASKMPIISLQNMRRAHFVREGIPQKLVAVHYCVADRRVRPLITGCQTFVNKDARARSRTHSGNRDEIVFKLQKYGIHIDCKFMNADGSLSVTNHRDWLVTRKTIESANDEIVTGSVPRGRLHSNSDIIIPRRFDVLFGRGRIIREHTGNLRCIHLVEMYQTKYERASKFEKTAIADRVVSIVYESYGRFLKWDVKVGD